MTTTNQTDQATQTNKWGRVPSIQKRISGYAYRSFSHVAERFIDIAFDHLYELDDDFFHNTDSYIAQNCCFAARRKLHRNREVPGNDDMLAAIPAPELLSENEAESIMAIAEGLGMKEQAVLMALWEAIATDERDLFHKESGRVHRSKLAEKLGMGREAVGYTLTNLGTLIQA